MQITLLGPLEVRSGSGEPCPVSGARLARLLSVLALQPGRVVSTTAIVDAVWGDEPPAEPGNAVQALVSRLRRAAPGLSVASRAQGYLLDIDRDAVDAIRFERLTRTDDADQLRTALDLWRGPALIDAGDAAFAVAARARLDELRLVALQKRIAADLRDGSQESPVSELEGLVATYPLREPLVVLLMRAHRAAGDRGRALATFDDARRRLADELGIAPSAELAAEHLAILRDEDESYGGTTADLQEATADPRDAAPSEDAGPTNLRTEISSFIGRDADIADLDRLLSQHRLVTLIGPGGAGKTRLAAHSAREQVSSSPGGVWMIEFAPVTDPGDVVGTVLADLGVRDRALMRTANGALAALEGVDLRERLIASLAHRNALLLFDNCEHLIDATATLAADILGSCPGIRILATSREPLGVVGEVLRPVEPLALPDAQWTSIEQLMTYPSIRLFAQRASAVRPGFAMTDANADAVVTICRALDGMPLAIELAAARMRGMSPDQVADRLGDRFATLSGGNRTALPRHQTLRAVVDWSWDLLDDAERVVWRRLAMFSGGATLEAAEAVCADQDFDTLTALGALVDKSLLTMRDEE
ncbi:MAG TPA: BTAD domain-containing putative transcriptional regulator, partial [Micromonosporaceae bacterium]